MKIVAGKKDYTPSRVQTLTAECNEETTVCHMMFVL